MASTGLGPRKGSQRARRLSRPAVRDDAFDAEILRGLDGALGEKLSLVDVCQRHLQVALAVGVLLRLFRHACHGLHGFQRIFAVGRLAAEHQGVGMREDGVGDVRHFGAGGARVVDHRVEHLCRHDDGLVLADTLFDDAALYARYLLDGHLYARSPRAIMMP